MTLILFTSHAPCALADELARQGHDVYEALAISEVLALVEQHPASEIVITPGAQELRNRDPSFQGCYKEWCFQNTI